MGSPDVGFAYLDKGFRGDTVMDRAGTRAVEGWLAAETIGRVLIVASPDIGTLDQVAAQFTDHGRGERIRVGRDLGNALLGLRPGRRAREAERWLRARCQRGAGHPVLLTEIDLLFHSKLDGGASAQLDPLALFIQTSRLTPIVVVWPGMYDGETLGYAAPGHAHPGADRRPVLG